MRDIVISVHIPKTGGTSFRRILQDTYGKGFLRAHPWDDLPEVLSGTTLTGSDTEIRDALEGVDCIHGHFNAQKFARLSSIEGLNPRFVTWIRDPVERAISTYYYLRNRQSRRSFEELTQWEQIAKSHDLDAFFTQHKFGHNRQMRQLGDIPLENFDFIGCTEAYDRSISIFNALFRPDRPVEAAPHERKNPEKTSSGYDIPDALRNLLIERNQEDIAVHRYARGWVDGAYRMVQSTQLAASPGSPDGISPDRGADD